MEVMRVLDLFSGIGGFSLGLERAGMRTVAFCEIDPYCRAVLRKHWPDVPCYHDVRELPPIGCDVISGGFPCQPFSHAGKQLGTKDDRHLWHAMCEVVRRERPAWVIGENVAGLINMGLDDVLSDLETMAYAVRTFVVPALAIGAPHRRDRLWIIARDRDRDRESALPIHDEMEKLQGNLADADSERGCLWPAEWEDAENARQPSGHQKFRNWLPEPDVGRVAHGVPSRVDRLRSLGNAVVPQIPEIIGRAIIEASKF